MTRLDFAGHGAGLEENPEGRFVAYAEAIGDCDLAVVDLCAAIISLIDRKADKLSIASARETIKRYCP